jgi:FAD/FMN-containing dehydrogenase
MTGTVEPQREPADPLPDRELADQLGTIVGRENVHTDDGRRLFFATDIFTSGKPVSAVVAPASSAELSRVLALCASAGRAAIPRGGGFSYTRGYVPVTDDAVTIDLRRLDAIREINAEDLYVVVEAGCTWAKLYDALRERGLRTPYFGPMSGFRATVGGALSQGSFFLGSTEHGTTADSVLGLELVLADGTILTTGSGASTHTQSPFFREYGPDLTGVFLHDSGALAFKTTAALKLIPFPKHHGYATLAFEADAQAAAIATMARIARDGLAGECYLWDPGFAAKMRMNNSMVDDLRYLGKVLRTGRNPLAGLIDGLKLATTGKRFLSQNRYLLHVTIDDATEGGARGKVDEVLRIGAGNGAEAIEPSIPRALRAMPFNDFTVGAFADQSMRTLPTHGIFPHSAIGAVGAAVDGFFAKHADDLDSLGITVGTIYFAIGRRAICCEPLFYWRDEQLAAHDRKAERSELSSLARMAERPAAGQMVKTLRDELVTLFTSLGAVHCQIGKAYPYRETRAPGTYALLEQVKQVLDGRNLVNPGALGLGLGDTAAPET